MKFASTARRNTVFDPGGAYEASAGATVQPGIGMAEHGARARRRIACSGAPDPATVPASPECFSAASRVSRSRHLRSCNSACGFGTRASPSRSSPFSRATTAASNTSRCTAWRATRLRVRTLRSFSPARLTRRGRRRTCWPGRAFRWLVRGRRWTHSTALKFASAFSWRLGGLGCHGPNASLPGRPALRWPAIGRRRTCFKPTPTRLAALLLACCRRTLNRWRRRTGRRSRRRDSGLCTWPATAPTSFEW